MVGHNPPPVAVRADHNEPVPDTEASGPADCVLLVPVLGKAIAGELAARVQMVKDSILRHRTDGALVGVSSAVYGSVRDTSDRLEKYVARAARISDRHDVWRRHIELFVPGPIPICTWPFPKL